jgi:hypothetical protein
VNAVFLRRFFAEETDRSLFLLFLRYEESGVPDVFTGEEKYQ